MKKVVIVLMIVLGVAVAAATLSSRRSAVESNRNQSSQAKENPPLQASRLPAHYKDAESARPLKATLDPAQFVGKTRRAYQVAKEIPETLAQLPCYCYCDQGFGHKSLHSCYEDEHSSQCVTCVDEALFAYRLEKELKMSPAQIRDEIIKRYSH